MYFLTRKLYWLNGNYCYKSTLKLLCYLFFFAHARARFYTSKKTRAKKFDNKLNINESLCFLNPLLLLKYNLGPSDVKFRIFWWQIWDLLGGPRTPLVLLLVALMPTFMSYLKLCWNLENFKKVINQVFLLF